MSNKQSSLAWDVEGLTLAQKVVLVKMADEANDEGLLVHHRRSQAYIARCCCAHVETVRSVIKWLEAEGFLEVLQRGSGRTQAKYRLTILEGVRRAAGDPDGSQDVETQSPAGAQHVVETPSAAEAPADPPETQPQTETPTNEPLAFGPRLGQPQRETGSDPACNPTPSAPSDPLVIPKQSRVPTFADFWDAVPTGKKVDKLAAETAWTRALKKGATPTELVDGMKRYAQETADRERRFVKHPATWLNRGGWNDEPGANLPSPRAGRGRKLADHDGPEGRIAI